MSARQTVRAALDDALEARDRRAVVSRAVRAVDDGLVTVNELYEILSEILVDVGSDWQAGAVEVWQEHLVTGVVRTIVEACVLRVEMEAPRDRAAIVVLATPSDEYHDLGLRMLADRFTLAGWRAQFLGADVPVSELMAAVRELGADAVALSVSTHFHRVTLRAYVAALAEAHPDLRIWVGGPAFALGYEGWPNEMVLDPLHVPPAGET